MAARLCSPPVPAPLFRPSWGHNCRSNPIPNLSTRWHVGPHWPTHAAGCHRDPSTCQTISGATRRLLASARLPPHARPPVWAKLGPPLTVKSYHKPAKKVAKWVPLANQCPVESNCHTKRPKKLDQSLITYRPSRRNEGCNPAGSPAQ